MHLVDGGELGLFVSLTLFRLRVESAPHFSGKRDGDGKWPEAGGRFNPLGREGVGEMTISDRGKGLADRLPIPHEGCIEQIAADIELFPQREQSAHLGGRGLQFEGNKSYVVMPSPDFVAWDSSSLRSRDFPIPPKSVT